MQQRERIMSEYGATVAWHLKPGASFDYEHFNRGHEWTFAGGEVVQASASPEYFGSGNRVNPDEAVIAATASCHMLTFLSIAAKQGHKVLSYIDQPTGTVEKGSDGRLAITRIVLRPRVVFDDGQEPEAAAMDKLHASAHRNCFVANSLKADISIEPI
jgi:organic hydroperoxide reductase OsmC/OhrA